MKRFHASALRENIYKILDRVSETGQEVEIDRKGKILKIVPVVPPSRLSCLKKRKVLRVPPEKIIHLHWEKEWKP